LNKSYYLCPEINVLFKTKSQLNFVLALKNKSSQYLKSDNITVCGKKFMILKIICVAEWSAPFEVDRAHV
jgi:hypothetical protein